MNVWGHFKTITSHKLLVMKYCFQVGLYRQGLLHDLSKYTPTEFWRGAVYYQGNRSPNDEERRENGCSACALFAQRVRVEWGRARSPCGRSSEFCWWRARSRSPVNCCGN